MIVAAGALAIGFVLDLLFGDPLSSMHPIVWIGKLISVLKKLFRAVFPKSSRGEYAAGACIWILTVSISTGIAWGVIFAAGQVSVWLKLMVESFICWQMLAVRSLRTESMKVYRALKNGTIEDARLAVSMIVGRETAQLDAAGVARAAVETVAENTSDGIIAPLIYMAIGGPVLGVFYKAVNTMDSMLGYTDPPYTCIGWVPAKMDDVLNYIPARISAFFMLAAGAILRLNVSNGWKIFCRDRYNHASPNSAQTESVCAGLLGLRLAGDAVYHGVLHKKPYIGDALRQIEPEDIPLTCRLLYAASVIGMLVMEALTLGAAYVI